MEQNQLTPVQAFKIIYEATGALQLNRQDSQVLDAALRSVAQLLPQDDAQVADEEVAPEAAPKGKK